MRAFAAYFIRMPGIFPSSLFPLRIREGRSCGVHSCKCMGKVGMRAPAQGHACELVFKKGCTVCRNFIAACCLWWAVHGLLNFGRTTKTSYWMYREAIHHAVDVPRLCAQYALYLMPSNGMQGHRYFFLLSGVCCCSS